MRFLKAFLLVVGGLLLLAPPAWGIATPDATPAPNPTMTEVTIWRHYLEDNDLLVVANYTISYATPPTETVEQAFIGRFGDTGAADFGSIALYPYDTKGYGKGIFTIYFTAAEVTSNAISWGDSSYLVRLSGNPSLAWTPTYSTVSSTSLSWKAYSTHEATVKALGEKILLWAQALATAWTETMLDTTGDGNVLASKGETYFSMVFPDLRTAVPAVFAEKIQAPVFRETTHPKTYESSLTAPTFIQDGLDAFADFWGLTSGFTGIILAFIVLIACIILGLKFVQSAEVGIVVALVVYVGGAKLGLLSLTALGIISLISIMLLGFILFLKRA